jgi:flavin-dependent dehydrogenase
MHWYDVIVVGARCAGSPTAMLLAQRGYRVLLVDRATFPSDTVSTLVIHPTGVAALRRWGVLDEVVASGCPPIEQYTFDFGYATLSGRPYPVDGAATAYAPRRTVLDAVLVRAAADAGVDVWEGCSVDDLLVDGGTVTGIRAHRAGCAVEARARVVVGADGWNSRVARLVGAERYRDQPLLERAFYAYWRDLPADGITTRVRDAGGFAAIPTSDGLTLVLAGCPAPQLAEFRRDVEGSYLATLHADPAVAELFRSATRVSRLVGGGVPNFFRVPYGPGWVLVGDAGYTKDPVTGLGISDAFRGAEDCSRALDEALSGRRSFDDVMAAYHRERDEQALPFYEFTTQLARLDPPPPELQHLLAGIQGNQDAMDAFVSVNAGILPPADFFALATRALEASPAA